MTASLDRGSLAAPPHLASSTRGVGLRLAWAAAASVIVHAALLCVPAATSPSASHPVVALIVRTIAAATDAAVPTPVSESAQEPAELAASPRPMEPAAAPANRRAADATSESARNAVRTPRVLPERTPAHEGKTDSAAHSASRDAAAPARGHGPVYHLAGELDPPPRPLHDIEPVYPPEAGFQPGTVVLRLYIDETGTVERVDVLQATAPGVFDDAARTAFAAARFSPGRIAGIAVKCQLTIEVEFTPINRGSDVSGRTY